MMVSAVQQNRAESVIQADSFTQVNSAVILTSASSVVQAVDQLPIRPGSQSVAESA